jgi:two-component system response regulator (stage 0 sporulation protein A)
VPELDGLAVLKQVRGTEPKYLVISALSQESFVNKALQLGASYYLIKPFDIKILLERVMDVYASGASLNRLRHNVYEKVVSDYRPQPQPQSQGRAIDEKISNIFIAVGIPAHIKGYQFLREAIKLTIEDPDIINSITKKLYPMIASRFNSSSSKVERGIRHAIEISWNRGKIENINTVFGVKIYTNHDKPTNGEFIALVADKLLIEGA